MAGCHDNAGNTGLPLQVIAANNLASYGFAVQHPNIANLKDLEVSNRTPERWFNAAAFTAPAAYTIGSAPRWFPNLRFDWARAADITLAKQFRFKERLTATPPSLRPTILRTRRSLDAQTRILPAPLRLRGLWLGRSDRSTD